MGECLIVRRGGQAYKLPVLSENYPQDVTIVASANGSAGFSVQIAEPGNPAEYTYKWQRNHRGHRFLRIHRQPDVGPYDNRLLRGNQQGGNGDQPCGDPDGTGLETGV